MICSKTLLDIGEAPYKRLVPCGFNWYCGFPAHPFIIRQIKNDWLPLAVKCQWKYSCTSTKEHRWPSFHRPGFSLVSRRNLNGLLLPGLAGIICDIEPNGVSVP